MFKTACFLTSLFSVASISVDASSWALISTQNSLSPRTHEDIGGFCRIKTSTGDTLVYITDPKLAALAKQKPGQQVFLADTIRNAFDACAARVAANDSRDLLSTDYKIWETRNGGLPDETLPIGFQTGDYQLGIPETFELGDAHLAHNAIWGRSGLRENRDRAVDLRVRNHQETHSWTNAKRQYSDRLENSHSPWSYLGYPIKWGLDLFVS